jgi:hypothetical protein
LLELRRHLVPRKGWKPGYIGTYTDRELDRVRGYRLLAHAEVESCLESLALAALDNAINGWVIDRKSRPCLIALMAFHEGERVSFPTAVSDHARHFLRSRLDSAKARYSIAVSNNHGVREVNVLRLLLPLGVREADLSGPWLATLDSFGAARGELAHRPGRALTPPDPPTEIMTVGQIVAGLRAVDRLLQTAALPG